MLERLTPYIGWTGFLFGVATAVMTPLPHFAIATFFCMIPAFLLSSLHIMLSARYQLKVRWIHPGYCGVLLASTPLLIALYMYLFR